MLRWDAGPVECIFSPGEVDRPAPWACWPLEGRWPESCRRRVLEMHLLGTGLAASVHL